MTPEQYAGVKKLFIKTLALKKEEREAFIERECVHDSEVKAEVLSLLQNHDEKSNSQELKSPLGMFRKAVSRWSSISQRASNRIILISLFMASISGLGLWTQHEVKRLVMTATTEHLSGSLDAVVAAFELWVEARLSMTERIAAEVNVRGAILELVQTQDDPKSFPLAVAHFSQILRPIARTGSFASFGVIDKDFRIVASSTPELVGVKLQHGSLWLRAIVDAFVGKSVFIAPHRYSEVLDFHPLPMISERPVVQFAVPIRDQQNRIQAAFVLTMDTESQYQSILSSGRTGKTSEIYAFDERGLMLSRSRFEDQLRAKGLLAPNQNSILNIQVREVGNPEYPFTQLALDAISSKDLPKTPIGGLKSTPYRDYRGAEVVGAWRWLPDFGLAIAAEADLTEVDIPLWHLKLSFAILIGLLTLALISAIFSSIAIMRLKREISERRRIGNYRIIKKLGEGGLGEVFLAQHDLLKRPTAIKILKQSLSDPEAVARFEKEVQLTCCLTQPHIVTVYDFGRTSDSTFYYAMEYLRGIDLGRILQIEGHLPYGRGVHLLLQVCQALQDAHAHGLIHRDIKPQNIMITRLGSENDFVKVVDFGLVKELDPSGLAQNSEVDAPRGTLLYTAPERFCETMLGDDFRVDIYSLGATAYKMFSGRNLFSATTAAALLYAILHENPLHLASLCPDCPVELADLIMSCVSRDPDLRPSTIVLVLKELLKIQKQIHWTDEDSNPWWLQHPELLNEADELSWVS